MSSENCKEYREYKILHQTSYIPPLEHCSVNFFKPIHYILLNNFIRMIDVTVFVHFLCLFNFKVL